MKVTKLELAKISERNKPTPSAPIVKKEDSFIPFGYEANVIIPEYTTEQLEAIKTEAYGKGVSDGKNQGVTETKQQVLSVEENAENTINNALSALNQSIIDLREEKTRFKQEITKVAAYSIKKILGEKLKEDFSSLLEQSFSEIYPLLDKEPKLQFYVPERIRDNIEGKIKKIMQTNNYEGDIEVIADQTLTENSCKVEWDKNGIIFDYKEKIDEIDNIINEFIKTI